MYVARDRDEVDYFIEKFRPKTANVEGLSKEAFTSASSGRAMKSSPGFSGPSSGRLSTARGAKGESANQYFTNNARNLATPQMNTQARVAPTATAKQAIPQTAVPRLQQGAPTARNKPFFGKTAEIKKESSFGWKIGKGLFYGSVLAGPWAYGKVQNFGASQAPPRPQQPRARSGSHVQWGGRGMFANQVSNGWSRGGQ